MGDTLTDKQRRFVEEYLIDYNGTRAAKTAGYAESSAHVTASQLLTNPKISGAVAQGLAAQINRTQLTADTVLAGLWREMKFAEFSRDRLRALELIGKHFAMFTDKVAIDGDLPEITFNLKKDE